MKIVDNIKLCMPEVFYNYFFYYYLHLKNGAFPPSLNLTYPKTFNQKIIWLKLFVRYSNAPILVDKILAKEYVKERIGQDHVIPNIAIFDSAEDIDFNALPDSFVLKANHGSGWNIICHNKDNLDIPVVKSKLNNWLKTNYYAIGKEYQYRNIKPQILCEEYLPNTVENPLVDFKFFCFHGVPHFLQVDLDRFSNHTRNFYDIRDDGWILMPFTTLYPIGSNKITRPDCLEEMLQIAAILSKDLIFSRIDLYVHNNRVLFGEITLHHGGGFEPFLPKEYDYYLGQFIRIPSQKHIVQHCP